MQKRCKIFTDLSINAFGPGYHWDPSFPAFGIYKGARVTSFILVRHGGRRIKVGRYPSMSLKEARRRAHGFASLKEAPKDTLNINDALEAYFASLVLREKTTSEYKRVLARLALRGTLGNLTPHGVLTRINAFRDAPHEARHMYFAASAFFSWCTQRALMTHHPLRSTRCPFKPTSRSRVLTDSELKAVWHATAEDNYGAIVRLLILTGQRRMEIASLEPGWIKPDMIVFPASICKNHTEHQLPITPEIHRIAHELAADLLQPHNSWTKPKIRLDRASGVAEWTLHDLRRTFSTLHARIGTPPHVTEALLTHKTGSISPLARIYNRHNYGPEMRAAMSAYEGFLARLMSP